MSLLRLSILCLLALAGCATARTTAAPTPPLRVLSCEAPALKPAAADPSELPAAASAVEHGATRARIGAPGGSGAGSRRVVPVQSGNETVEGFPAGTAAGVGAAAGRG